MIKLPTIRVPAVSQDNNRVAWVEMGLTQRVVSELYYIMMIWVFSEHKRMYKYF